MQIDEQRIQYLILIQNAIDRMANTSSIFKGFAAAIVAGVITISVSETQWLTILFGVFPLFCFATLDIYYLRIERKYRYLYNQVCSKAHEADFSMNIEIPRQHFKLAKYRIIDCIRSQSIILFYGPIIVIAVLAILLKYYCII